MGKKPLTNALGALFYIVVVASVMFYGTRSMPSGEDGIIAPIAAMSIFTLSAAVMGYFFLYHPAELYFDGKKQAGVKLFLQTVTWFGVITLVCLGLMFSGLLSG